MVSTKKSIGNVTLAGIFAAATMAAAVPAFASTTTVEWQFYGGSGANSDIGSSATFTGTPSVTGLNLGITASGYEVSTTVDANGNVNYKYSKAGSAKPYDLYNKDIGASEQGLGLITVNYPSGTKDNGMADGEISDTTPTPKYYNWRYTGETYDTGMIQLDLSSLLGYAISNGASITIGSLSTSSKDVAVFSGTDSAGQFGTVVGTPLSYTTSGVGSETLSLSDLTDPSTHQYYSYLNISVAKPGQSVLLSTLSLTFNTNNGGPSAAPVPATAGLTLAGALGMGMMLLARRRRSML